MTLIYRKFQSGNIFDEKKSSVPDTTVVAESTGTKTRKVQKVPEEITLYNELPRGLLTFNKDVNIKDRKKLVKKIHSWVKDKDVRGYPNLEKIGNLAQVHGATIDYTKLSDYNFGFNNELEPNNPMPEKSVMKIRRGLNEGYLQPLKDGYEYVDDKLPNVSDEVAVKHKSWLNDWWSAPETAQRLEDMRANVPFSRRHVTFGSGYSEDTAEEMKDNINRVKIKDNDVFSGIKKLYVDAAYAYYSPRHHLIVQNIKGRKNMTHELTHGSHAAKVPGANNTISEAIKGDNTKRSRYMRSNEEVYSRIMQIRKNAGIKPGQKITPESYDKIMSKKIKQGEDLFEAYNKETIIKLLNTLASNSKNTPTKTSIARQGGILYRLKQ